MICRLSSLALHCSNSGGASHSMTSVPTHCSLLAWRCRNGVVQTPGGEWVAAEPGTPNNARGSSRWRPWRPTSGTAPSPRWSAASRGVQRGADEV